MAADILELYPNSGTRRTLEGAYLSHDLQSLGTREQPFTYANFVSSIDGRIAAAEAETDEPYVLEGLANSHDWRLFQELQAQSDCQVTHGGYLRALAEGKFGDILQVGLSEDAKDLAAWRRERGLAAQPGVAVVSRSLDFPLAPSLARHEQPVHIVTGEDAPEDRVRYWKDQGFDLHFAGRGPSVEGGPMIRLLGSLGYTRLYLLAGPEMLETVLRDRALSRLYVTLTHQIIGGEAFHTMASGPLLGEAGRLKLNTLYYDEQKPNGTGQWFSSFDLGY